MSRIRGKNTKLELLARKRLRNAGYKGLYRIHYGPCHIDIAFPKKKIAVFLDSCFWHQCPEHFKMPKTNLDYWIPKMEYGKARETEVTEKLRAEGWTVVRIWEHEIEKEKT